MAILDDNKFYRGCSSSGADIFLLLRRTSFLYEQASPFIIYGNVQVHVHGSPLNISNSKKSNLRFGPTHKTSLKVLVSKLGAEPLSTLGKLLYAAN